MAGVLRALRLLPAVLLAGGAVARADTLAVRAEVRVPLLQSLDATPGILDPVPATVADLERGALDVPEGVTLTVSSNVPWELYVRRADPGGPAIEVSADGGPHRPALDAWLPVASGPGGVEGERHELRLRVVLSWTAAAPGDHALRLEYRLAPRGA